MNSDGFIIEARWNRADGLHDVIGYNVPLGTEVTWGNRPDIITVTQRTCAMVRYDQRGGTDE